MSHDAPNSPYDASNPHASFLNVSCLDLLLIELVPLAERMASRPPSGTSNIGGQTVEKKSATSGVRNGPGQGTAFEKLPDDEPFRDAIFFRLDSLGYRVGQGLSERFTCDRPRFLDNLEVIKFLCKDLWTIVFKKQVDNLKTNHRGVYVLTDNMFRPFTRMSTANRSEAVLRAQTHLWFPCGIIRGALASLGINATVHAETTELPQATFQIKTIISKS